MTGVYAELNGDTEIRRNRLRYNVGVRYVKTDQTVDVTRIAHRSAQPGDRSAAVDGSLYPNVVTFADSAATTTRLPSVKVA